MSQSTGVDVSPIRWHKTRTATRTALRCRQQCDADSTAIQTWPASDDSVPMSDSKRPSPSWTLGTVPQTVFLARHAGLRSGGMGTVSDDIEYHESTEED